MMESEVGEPRRVGGPTRHGGAQYDVARFFGSLFGCFGALEAQRDMAEAQCDVAHSFGSLLSSFAAFEVEPRRVGAPTRHGRGPIRRGALFLPSFGLFWCL